MPEGDTIHELAAALRDHLLGETLVAARAENRDIDGFVGQRVDGVVAVGKHLFVTVGDRTLRSHLGMHGKWLRGGPDFVWSGPAWRIAVRLATERVALCCIDAKELELLDVAGQRLRALLRRLGPDLALASFDPATAVQRARERLPPEAPLVDVLLDQRIAAGIGNVYKSETLFLEGLAPMRRLDATTDERLHALFERAGVMLRQNLRPGPRQTRAARPSSSSGRSPDDPGIWVYHRGGEPCLVCRTVIRHARLGRHSRGTWWCERCQPE